MKNIFKTKNNHEPLPVAPFTDEAFEAVMTILEPMDFMFADMFREFIQDSTRYGGGFLEWTERDFGVRYTLRKWPESAVREIVVSRHGFTSMRDSDFEELNKQLADALASYNTIAVPA